MTSAIDATKPEEGQAYTADMRANFARARDEISDLQARVIDLESQMLLAAIGTWQWQTAPQTGSISNAHVGLDADTAVAAATLWITTKSDDNSDFAAAFAALAAGDGLLLWDRKNSANRMRFAVMAAALDFTTFFTIPVSLVSQAGVEPLNNADVNVQFLFSPSGGAMR